MRFLFAHAGRGMVAAIVATMVSFPLTSRLLAADAAASLPPGLYAEITTPRGTFVSELFFQKTPLTVASFVGLAEGKLGPEPRKPFFDGLTFHRVVPDFVIQGGDPGGTGDGGPGYEFPDELRGDLSHDAVGILSMANAGPDTNGSQFFFTLKPVRRLDFMHSVFGRVVQGLDVLPRVVQGDKMEVKILRVGAEAKAFRADDARFAELMAAAPKGIFPHFDDPGQLLPANPPRARGFASKLANLERFGALKFYARVFPKREAEDADAKPGSIAKRFAKKFGVEKDGVVALYFVDRDEWALWIGDTLLPRFNPDNASLHDAKQAFLKSASERAQAAIAAAIKDAPPVPDQQKIKLQVDEVIDGMIDLLARPK